MGNELSRARVLTVSSFLVNFVVQIGGMVSTPNMKDVADAVRNRAYTQGGLSDDYHAYIEPLRLLPESVVYCGILLGPSCVAARMDPRALPP